MVALLIYLNKKKLTEIDSNTAFGKALVAYSNLDYDNAKFQFESIAINYESTNSASLSNYYLGKIEFQNKNYEKAKMLLYNYLENANDAILICGAIKQLVDISIQEKNYYQVFDIISKADDFKIDRPSFFDLELLKVAAYIGLDDSKNAKYTLDKISNFDNLPQHVKQKMDELYGML